MTWLFQIDDSHPITFTIYENSAHGMQGECASLFFPNSVTGNFPVERLKEAKLSWSLNACDVPDVNIDGNNAGLLEQVRSKPNGLHVGIFMYPGRETQGEDSVHIELVVPPEIYGRYQRLVELSLTSKIPLRRTFSVPFHGFRVPTAETKTPTWEEFLQGKPSLYEEFGFSLGTVPA
ncbi:hypothetical protein [Robbsia andropogonis]|uniref:hypothetical protein n=1 Tax=Robbsia andropogonis TaxID=28092 RepID=UPI002A6B73A4|nr:hypothetical protein [Robbsia andropogonis]